MKMNGENKIEEVTSSLESSYTVEPGYVKQMISRFSGFSNGDDNTLFKLPLLHSTKTKTHEPFQYPVLLANRSSVPVKANVNMRVSKDNYNSYPSNNSNNSNHFHKRNTIRSEERINKSCSREQSPANLISSNNLVKSWKASQNNKEQFFNNSKPISNSLYHNSTYNNNNNSSSNINNNNNDAHNTSNKHTSAEKQTLKTHNLKLNLNGCGVDAQTIKNSEDVVDSKGLPSKMTNLNSTIKDGHYFLALMAQKSNDMLNLCQEFQNHLTHPGIDEGVLGKIRAAIGKANLLLTKKFKQFDDLCAANLEALKNTEQFQVTNEDLEGFWDMMLIQIDDVDMSFKELQNIKENDWKLPSTPPPTPIQSPTSKHPPTHRLDSTPKSSKTSGKTPSNTSSSKRRSSRLQAAIQAGRRQRKSSQGDEVVIFVADKSH